MTFELARDNERLECDFFVWWNTTHLARAFGWKPRSPNLSPQFALKFTYHSRTVEVTDEDAQSLAAAIWECVRMLAKRQRPSRRAMAYLMFFTVNVDREIISLGLEEPARIARFCCKGGFRMNLKL